MKRSYIVLFCLSAVFLCSALLIGSYKEKMVHPVEMVISRYNESMDWLKDDPFHRYSYIVYNKGTNRDYYVSDKMIKELELDNVGRESHTYLYHIIHHWDDLADITVFLPGSMELEHKYARGVQLLESVKKEKTSKIMCIKAEPSLYESNKDFTLDKYLSSNTNNKTVNTDDNVYLSSIRPFSLWYEHLFGKPNNHQCFSMNSIMAITREDIHKKGIDHYKSLIEHINQHHNQETGHYFERAWPEVFGLTDEQYFLF